MKAEAVPNCMLDIKLSLVEQKVYMSVLGWLSWVARHYAYPVLFATWACSTVQMNAYGRDLKELYAAVEYAQQLGHAMDIKIYPIMEPWVFISCDASFHRRDNGETEKK